jgi:hypothetical protein
MSEEGGKHGKKFLARYLKRAMTKAYGYIHAIFGLEASHASVSEQALR